MKITNVKLNKFGKHEDRNFEIKDFNIVKGPNGSGKSTIQEAISYTLTGSIRRLNKKLEDLSKMSSTDGSLAVEVSTEEDNIVREIIINRGKPSEMLNVSSFDESLTNTEKQELLKEKYEFEDVLVNPTNFILLSPTDKSKYILSLLNNVNDDKTRILDLIKSFGESEVVEECLSQLDNEEPLIDNIDSLLKFLNSYKRMISKEIKANEENTYKIADIKAEIAQLDSNSFKAIPSLEKELAELNHKISISKEMAQKRVSYQSEIKLLTEKQKNFKTKKVIQEEIEQVKTQILQFQTVKLDDNLEEVYRKYMGELSQIKEQGTKVKLEIEYAEKDIQKITNLGLSLSNIGKTKQCIIDTSITCNNSFGNKLGELRKELSEEREKLNNLKKEREDLAVKYKTIDSKLNDVLEQIKIGKGSYQIAQQEIAGLNKRLETLRDMDTQISNVDNRLSLLRDELDKIEIIDASIIEKMILSKKEDLAVIYKNQEEFVKLNQTLKLGEEEDKVKDLRKSKLDTTKKIEKMLKGEKLSILENGIAPFKETMDTILEDLNFPYKVFIKNDGKKATIGFSKDDKDIEIDRLSTGENIMFIIALIGAIYQKKESLTKLLVLDDIDNLDKENFKRILENHETINKYFDNVILIGILENLDLEKCSKSNINVIEM